MNVAELLYLRGRRPFLHQFLLRLHDGRGIDFTEFTDKVGTYTFKVFSFTEPAQVSLQLFGLLIRGCSSGCCCRSRLCCFDVRHGAFELKAVCHQGGYHIHHGDVLHLCALWNGHDFADGIEDGLLCDFRKTEVCHNIDEFRILFRELEYSFVQVNLLGHLGSPSL